MLLRKIAASILFFLSFLSFLVFFLINGIKIDSISIGGFKISQFYIKLDKKLILRIDEIVIRGKQSSTTNSFEDIKSIIDKAPKILNYFEEIDIYKLKISDNEFNIKLDDKLIYVDNKFVNISSSYSKDNEILNLDIYSIFLKDYDLILLGDLKIDLQKNLLAYFGNYIYQERIEGDINLQANEQELDFHIDSQKLPNIKFLKDYMSLDRIAEAWMYENVIGDYHLDFLSGKVNLETLTPILNSIKGQARVENATVQFHKNLDAIETSLINLTYENDKLLIQMKEPTYKGISLDGSFVHIKDMTSLKYGHVDVALKANQRLDDNVLEILQAFKINLPIKQTSGQTDAHVFLYIPYDSPMETYGVFQATDSNFSINDFNFYSKKANVDLINSNVVIKNSDFVSGDLIDANINMTIDTKALTSNGDAKINKFEVKTEESNIIEIQDKKVSFELDFNENTKLKISELDTEINFYDDKTNIKINNLKNIVTYSKLIQDLGIKDAELNLNLIDDKYDFITTLYGLNLPLRKDQAKIEKLRLSGYVLGDIVKFNTLSNDLMFTMDKEKIDIILNGYDIDYKDSNESSSLNKDIFVRLLDSNVNINEDSFFSIDSNIKLLEKETRFDGLFKLENLPLSKNGEKLKTLNIQGKSKDGITSLTSKDNLIKMTIENDALDIYLDRVDLHYDTNDTSNSESSKIRVYGKNSNIIVNDKHKVLANVYEVIQNDEKTSFDLFYNNGEIKYLKNINGELSLKASGINDIFVNTFFDKEIIEGGTFDINASGEIGLLQGRLDFNENRLLNLAVLNNLITLVNTSPALINPLLAVPALFGIVTNEGFNVNGYSVNEGYVDFSYSFDNKFLNMTKIHTVGNSVDFEGFGTIDFTTSTVNSELQLIFLKDYSKVVSLVPWLGYVFLGDDKRVSSMVEITGKLDDPKIESKIAEESITAPVDILKRIFTSPFKIFE